MKEEKLNNKPPVLSKWEKRFLSCLTLLIVVGANLLIIYFLENS